MSLKDLFGKKSLSVNDSVSLEDISSDVESIEYIEEFIKNKQRFVPNIDFENPENFSRYGSAEKYYEDSIKSVYKSYPYDGSLKERIQWHNKSSDLTNYIFENSYPRKNGYVQLGEEYGTLLTSDSGYYSSSKEEYISFNGSLNSKNVDGTSKKLFEKSNKLSLEDNRGYNLNLNGEVGSTVEFYFKRNNFSGSDRQVIFDSWNNISTGSSDYGRFKIEVRPGIVGQKDKFYVEVSSGSYGVVNAEIGTDLEFSGSWHHYGIAFINSGSSLKMQLFVDGDLSEEVITGSAIQQIYGAMNGQIGALITAASGTLSGKGWGKLSGSLDEFRFWKTKRTDKEIARNYFTTVGGGTNTDDSNVNLGVYFKFNEGIYSTGSISGYDKNVLDYSGRISNGIWTGYSLSSRQTGSAIVEAGFSNKEFKDPIIYPGHEEILSIISHYTSIGDEYDRNNNASIYNTLPEWMADEDSENGGGLKTLMQIMSEFFDDMHLKIELLPTLKDKEYSEGKPLPFSEKLLEDHNFQIAQLFSDSSLMEIFLGRNEVENYEEKIYDIKNFIYQNIYNNILYIYRSKGTEKSFRNLIRCFGIDEQLIKINMYSSDSEYELKDTFQYKTENKKYVDFNNPDRFDSSIHQAEQPGNPNSLGYLPGSPNLKPFGSTLEAEVIFPTKFKQNDILFFETPFVSCSLFGMHESSNGTWISPDRASVQVFAVKDEEGSDAVRFLVSSSYFGIQVTSSLYKETYADQKWNFSLSLKHEKYPIYDGVLGSSEGDYILQLYGVNTVQDIKQESFILTASVPSASAEQFFEADKMIYAGAHRVNFSGSVVTGPGVNNEQFSDAKISSVRYWNNYIENDIIDLHAKDINNFGSNETNGNIASFLSTPLSGTNVKYKQISQAETLALHWDFVTVTSSDNGTGISTLDDGEFIVEDASSGSLSLLGITKIAPQTKYQFTGKGIQFPRNSEDVVQIRYIRSAKRNLPEVINNSDFIQILQQDDEYFRKEVTQINHYFAIEKSMYQTISEDILNMFGTVRDFNNLIGKPKSRYESSYKELVKLREIYFRNVQNEPDFERFIDFFKWIDDSISRMIEQLIPASMDYSSGVSNIIESHILERNKYRHKLPTIEFKSEPPLGPAKTINELLYKWKTGHAPINGLESENCDWWLLRAERTGSLNYERQGIFEAATSALNRNFSTVYNFQSNLVTITYDKKRETEIIRNEVGFDLTGAEYFEISDLIETIKDCDD